MEDRWSQIESVLERLAEAQAKTEEEIRKLWEDSHAPRGSWSDWRKLKPVRRSG